MRVLGIKNQRVITDAGEFSLKQAKELADKGLLCFAGLPKSIRSSIVRQIHSQCAPLIGGLYDKD